MRWLEWTLRDPRGMVGGVETHLLSMAACLAKRGVEVCYSSDPRVLFEGRDEVGPFEVIRSHGAALPPRHLFEVRNTSAVRVHTLHGSAIGMMMGLGEWHRFTHIKAFYRELSGCLRADVVASIHPDLELFQRAPFFGTRRVVTWNGWDSACYLGANGGELAEVSAPDQRWAFIGRLWDRVKGADRVLTMLETDPALELVAIPGDGLPDHPRIHKTGRLSPRDISELLKSARGLLVPSRWEGLSLVMLEALAAGVPVVATRVGGQSFAATQGAEGLFWIESPDDMGSLLSAVRSASCLSGQRQARSEHNQRCLWTWESCTQRLIEAINPILLKKAGKQIQISAKP